MDFKGFYQLASVTTPTTGTTAAWPSLLFNTSEYSQCDVLVNVGTLMGTTKVSFSFQENFSDLGYLETANTGSISATGVVWLTHDPIAAAGSIPSNIKMSSPLIGKGREKQVVMSLTPTTGTASFTAYVLPYPV